MKCSICEKVLDLFGSSRRQLSSSAPKCKECCPTPFPKDLVWKCCICGHSKKEEDFSKTQWKTRRKYGAKCHTCVSIREYNSTIDGYDLEWNRYDGPNDLDRYDGHGEFA